MDFLIIQLNEVAQLEMERSQARDKSQCSRDQPGPTRNAGIREIKSAYKRWQSCSEIDGPKELEISSLIRDFLLYEFDVAIENGDSHIVHAA